MQVWKRYKYSIVKYLSNQVAFAEIRKFFGDIDEIIFTNCNCEPISEKEYEYKYKVASIITLSSNLFSIPIIFIRFFTQNKTFIGLSSHC